MPVRKYVINPVKELVRQGKLAGILLVLATVLSMLLSNSENSESWLNLWQTKIGFGILNKSLLHWINDGLMVIFFLLVGLEIKREMVHGELASVRKAILPAGAAIGGILVPALVYLLFHTGHPETLAGWAIPTATDIAFSLGVLSLLGKRVPLPLKIFLMALAIIDDIGAILIIAIVYTSDLHLVMLLLGTVVFAGMVLMNRLGVKQVGFYLLPAVLLWFFILESGVHATIAGVLTAMIIPMESIEDFEHSLTRPVNYMILPLFALANTAIPLSPGSGGEIFTPLSMGIVFGLLFGKPFGIVAASYILIAFGWARLPDRTSFRQMLGLGFIAGIGFTMSIFIASLSFEPGEVTDMAKLSILAGSILAALTGGLILLSGSHHQESPGEAEEP